MTLTAGHTTWGGNRAYAASELLEPTSVDQAVEAMMARDRVRVLGTRHSFNGVADTDGTHLWLGRIPVEVEVDRDAATARVSGWATYAQIAPLIDEHGLALHQMASLPHISVAGGIATATHGSGRHHQNLSAAVVGLTLVDGRGREVELRRGDADFEGHVVHLGALGLVTSVTLRLVEAREHHQRVYEQMPAEHLAADPLAVLGLADSVSCFTRWRDRVVDLVVLKSSGDPDDDPDDVGGARRAGVDRHPVPGCDPVGVTEQLGRPGRWYERLPHFRPDHQPSSGREIQSEWFVPLEQAGAAIEAIWAVGPRLTDALQVSELRTIAADDLWLSPAHGRDVLALHFTWGPDHAVVDPAVDIVEEALAPFDALPHWGKVADPAGWRRYPRLPDFLALRERRDPDRRLANDFLASLEG